VEDSREEGKDRSRENDVDRIQNAGPTPKGTLEPDERGVGEILKKE